MGFKIGDNEHAACDANRHTGAENANHEPVPPGRETVSQQRNSSRRQNGFTNTDEHSRYRKTEKASRRARHRGQCAPEAKPECNQAGTIDAVREGAHE